MARLTRPSIVVNFKTYMQGSGKNSEKLAKILARHGRKNLILAVQNPDVYRVSKAVNLPVYAQHIDPYDPGKHTGKEEVHTLKDNGASGVLINHSEDRMDIESIKNSVELAKKVGLTALVCIDKPGKAKSIARLKPDMIAIEPPELIGTGISVSKAKPSVVTKTLNAVKEVDKNIDVLCGAGISSKEDVRKAIDLGCDGVLVASAVVTAKKPGSAIKEFLSVV